MDFLRLDAGRSLEPARKSELGQFFTPPPVARLMASMLECRQQEVRILDAGAGVGSLFAAAVAELCARGQRPRHIRVTAYEVDAKLAEYLPDTFQLCRSTCAAVGVKFTGELVKADFITSAVELLGDGLFTERASPGFTCAILNPPYRKIHSESEARRLLRQVGVETSNLYTGFLAAAVKLLDPGGELVAITPRSFCNGSYFRPFRESFLKAMALRQLYVFEWRQQAFRDDDVLQENVIVRAVKGGKRAAKVVVASAAGPEDELPLTRAIPYDQVVLPGDAQSFIHISPDDLSQRVAERMAAFQTTLADLGLTVSTGRVVDFRAKEFLRDKPAKGTAPLVWPTHFDQGYIAWPKPESKKPNAIALADACRDQLVPNEPYVLVRRFSAKEERRRVVAAVYDPGRVPGKLVGFENHLNYFHRNGSGLDLALARGLAAFLNSTLLDASFRQFNGHTQVNATDLRNLGYPTLDQLKTLGAHIGDEFPGQAELDRLIEKELLHMAAPEGVDVVKVKQRVDEALAVLRSRGVPSGSKSSSTRRLALA